MELDKYKIKATYHSSTRIDEPLSDKFFRNIIFHDTYKNLLIRIANLSEEKIRHGYTLTGPYGSGKSTFGLLLSGLLASDNKVRKSAEDLLPPEDLKLFKKTFSKRNNWVVVKVVSGGDSFINEIFFALQKSLSDFFGSKTPKELSNLKKPRTYKKLLEQLELVAKYVEKRNAGLFIIYDELGKVFENAQKNNIDIHFFQELEERFLRNYPFFFLGILHQSFEEYAKTSQKSVQEEWGKVQGRYVDLPFSIDIEEFVKLINNAIIGKEFKGIKNDCQTIISSIDDSRIKNLTTELVGCWPFIQ